MSALDPIVAARAAGSMPMMPPITRLQALTEAVLARLRQSLSPSVHIERFPDRPESFDMQGRDAVVLVLCNAGSFAAPKTANAAAVIETVTIACPVLVRSLEGQQGHEALIEDVRLALQGSSLAGGTAMRPTGWALVDSDEGVFRFDLTFETNLPAVSGSTHPLMRAMP